MTKQDTLGLRELTDAELGYLRTTRNYGGAVILAFVKMAKDAAALDLADVDEAAKLQEKIRGVVRRANLSRQIQVYTQGKTLILARPIGAERLTLNAEQEEKLQ